MSDPQRDADLVVAARILLNAARAVRLAGRPQTRAEVITEALLTCVRALRRAGAIESVTTVVVHERVAGTE